jgi:hypothetical protein
MVPRSSVRIVGHSENGQDATGLRPPFLAINLMSPALLVFCSAVSVCRKDCLSAQRLLGSI